MHTNNTAFTVAAAGVAAAAIGLFTLLQAGTYAAPINVRKPNLYQFSGDHLQISYSTSGIDGRPHFSYKDGGNALSFNGDQIRSVSTELGTEVSVTIQRTVDTGSTSFTLLLPNVNLTGVIAPPVDTVGITTVHRFSPIRIKGQTDSYSVTHLTGTAQSVVF